MGTKSNRCMVYWPSVQPLRMLGVLAKTGGYRISGNARFYPEHCKLPIEEPADRIARKAKALSSSIKEMIDRNRKIPGRHAEALTRLENIFNLNLEIKQWQNGAERQKYQSSEPTSKAEV